MDLKIKTYMQRLEERMEEVMESPITCRNAELLSVYIKAWHDIDSMVSHDDPKKQTMAK